MNTLDQILRYIRTELLSGSNSDITPDTGLFGEGMLDSAAMLDLLLWVEEAFQLSVQNEDLTPENFGTARNLAEYVKRSMVLQSRAE